jgi:hypothetical protein
LAIPAAPPATPAAAFFIPVAPLAVSTLIVALLVLACLLVPAIPTVVLPTLSWALATLTIATAGFRSLFIAASLLVGAVPLSLPVAGLLGTGVFPNLITAVLRCAVLLAYLIPVTDLGPRSALSWRGISRLSRCHQLWLCGVLKHLYLLALTTGLARRLAALTRLALIPLALAPQNLTLQSLTIVWPGAARWGMRAGVAPGGLDGVDELALAHAASALYAQGTG